MLPISFLVGGLAGLDAIPPTVEGPAGRITNAVAMTHTNTTVLVLVASRSGGKTEIDQTKADAYTRLEPDFRRDYEAKYADSGMPTNSTARPIDTDTTSEPTRAIAVWTGTRLNSRRIAAGKKAPWVCGINIKKRSIMDGITAARARSRLMDRDRRDLA